EAHDSAALIERQPLVQQFVSDFDADRPNRDGTRQREAPDDRERRIFQQQTSAQLPVEPRDRGQAGIHTLHSSRPHMRYVGPCSSSWLIEADTREHGPDLITTT